MSFTSTSPESLEDALNWHLCDKDRYYKKKKKNLFTKIVFFGNIWFKLYKLFFHFFLLNWYGCRHCQIRKNGDGILYNFMKPILLYIYIFQIFILKKWLKIVWTCTKLEKYFKQYHCYRLFQTLFFKLIQRNWCWWKIA